ncbi:uncharacterized protein LOC143034160 [Oratosquilla oratoria]|uniref:uncharacterized protein LOC143034160 n=1 Tax=Oratosquilla oratoria TaxID=337810 RepID=UPI003F75FCF8
MLAVSFLVFFCIVHASPQIRSLSQRTERNQTMEYDTVANNNGNTLQKFDVPHATSKSVLGDFEARKKTKRKYRKSEDEYYREPKMSNIYRNDIRTGQSGSLPSLVDEQRQYLKTTETSTTLDAESLFTKVPLEERVHMRVDGIPGIDSDTLKRKLYSLLETIETHPREAVHVILTGDIPKFQEQRKAKESFTHSYSNKIFVTNKDSTVGSGGLLFSPNEDSEIEEEYGRLDEAVPRRSNGDNILNFQSSMSRRDKVNSVREKKTKRQKTKSIKSSRSSIQAPHTEKISEKISTPQEKRRIQAPHAEKTSGEISTSQKKRRIQAPHAEKVSIPQEKRRTQAPHEEKTSREISTLQEKRSGRVRRKGSAVMYMPINYAQTDPCAPKRGSKLLQALPLVFLSTLLTVADAVGNVINNINSNNNNNNNNNDNNINNDNINLAANINSANQINISPIGGRAIRIARAVMDAIGNMAVRMYRAVVPEDDDDGHDHEEPGNENVNSSHLDETTQDRHTREVKQIPPNENLDDPIGFTNARSKYHTTLNAPRGKRFSKSNEDTLYKKFVCETKRISQVDHRPGMLSYNVSLDTIIDSATSMFLGWSLQRLPLMNDNPSTAPFCDL